MGRLVAQEGERGGTGDSEPLTPSCQLEMLLQPSIKAHGYLSTHE